MYIAEITDWIKNEVQPITLTTPDATLAQMVQTAVRYWNVHAAFKKVKMYTATGSTTTVALDADFKDVVQVYPATQPDWILENFPLWSLLGITIIDNVTSDLVMLAEGYKNYKYYIGTDFKFTYVKSDNPLVGGTLYMSNLPYNTLNICVIGTKRLVETEDITSEYVLDWLLQYSKALIMIQEGVTLRKADAIGIRNDGDRLISENMELKKELQKQLFENGRWTSFCRKF